MKHTYFYTILIIALITSSIARKTTKRSKVKTKTTNSWDDGFDCSIETALGNGPYSKEGTGKFFPKLLESPTDINDKICIMWTMTGNPTGNLAKIMTKGLNNKWCLPYRLIISGFSYTNPFNDNKYTEGWASTDDGTVLHVKIVYPNKLVGWYINDEEAQKINGLIAKQRTEQQNQVKAAKSTLSKHAATYLTYKPLLDVAQTSNNSLVEKQNTLTTKIAEIQHLIESKKAEQLRLQQELEAANNLATAKDSELTSLTNTLNGMNSQFQQNTKTLADYSSSSTDTIDTANKIKAEMDKGLSKFNSAIEVLKREAPQRMTEINAVVSAFTILNSKDVSKNLDFIKP